MPFTPFHFGPGLLLKSAAPRHVSVASYAAANIVIDVETAYHLVQHDATVHQFAHTFLGAGIVGLAVGASMALVARAARPRGGTTPAAVGGEIAAAPIVLGALLGAITHPLLDGFMHPDIHPFRPFSDANPLRGLVSVSALQTACVLSAVLGAVILFARRATWTALACLLLIAPTATSVDIALNTPMRLGEMARALPDEDVLALERVASAHGVSPWLIRGPGDPRSVTQSIDAYGVPKTTTTVLRRGPMATLSRRRTVDRASWERWAVDGRAEYAQVAMDGDGFVWLENDADPGRPFRVNGRVTDAELVSLVTVIRANPSGPVGETRVRGDWPVILISRQTDGTIDVLLRSEALEGQRVTVRSRNSTWTIVAVRSWAL